MEEYNINENANRNPNSVGFRLICTHQSDIIYTGQRETCFDIKLFCWFSL